MSTGGSGFLVLTYRNTRLAYLRVLRHEPPAPEASVSGLAYGSPLTRVSSPLSTGVLEAEFHELGASAVWEGLARAYPGSPLRECLQRGMREGTVELHRIVRSSTGAVNTQVFDVRTCQLQELLAEGRHGLYETVGVAGGLIAKTIRVTPYPSTSHFITPPAAPAKATPAAPEGPYGNTEAPALQVARYALRTFDLKTGDLGGVYKRGANWNGGGASAVCLDSEPCARPPSPTPHRCGLYGTLSLAQQLIEYPTLSKQCIAVFAAEGRTMLGTKGLRTAHARIVGYWCASLTEKKIFDAHAPEARHFERIDDLLAEYGFPERDLRNLAQQALGTYVPVDHQAVRDWLSAEARWRQEQRRRRQLAVTLITGTAGTGGTSTVSVTGAQATWVLPASMTEAGKQAIAEALGVAVTPATSRCWNCNIEHSGPPGRCASCAAQFGRHHGTQRITNPLHCGRCSAVVDASGRCPSCGP